MQFPETPLIALTATCPASLLPSIMSILNLHPRTTQVYVGNLNRPNLFYAVIEKPSSAEAVIRTMVDWITTKHAGHKGIVYTLSKKESETVAEQLTRVSQGRLKCVAYHADVDAAGKSAAHRQWRDGSINIVVATIAFGTLIVF